MKKTRFKQVLVVAAIAAFATSISSCNRGYGCPNNFSIDQSAVQVVKQAVSSFAVE